MALEGALAIPPGANGIVVFVHGSGSGPRNQFVARVIRELGNATLLFDLLTAEEETKTMSRGVYASHPTRPGRRREPQTSFKPMLRTDAKVRSRRQPEKSPPKLPRQLEQPFRHPVMSEIHTYAELRKQIREALRRQHPEWIEANGKSPLCDCYEARFAELLSILAQRKECAAG